MLVHSLVGQVVVPGGFVGLCGSFVALGWYSGRFGLGFDEGPSRVLGPRQRGFGLGYFQCSGFLGQFSVPWSYLDGFGRSFVLGRLLSRWLSVLLSRWLSVVPGLLPLLPLCSPIRGWHLLVCR